MALMNKGLQRLKKLPTFTLDLKKIPGEQKVKIVDTARYSLTENPHQNKIQVIKRNRIAIPAEYKVADWMNGYVNDQIIDHDNNDPYEWAWDVLAHPMYQGLRIEVKTHYINENSSRWINVTTGKDGMFPNGSGINLGPVIKHRIADCIIILVAQEISPDVIQYNQVYSGSIDELTQITKRSKQRDSEGNLCGGYIMYNLKK